MIFLSAGHHQRSPGATYRGWTEHQLALAWVEEVFSHYPDRFIKVPSGKLKGKVSFINEHKSCSICVDFHFNSAMSEGVHVGSGCETLYYPTSSKGKVAAEFMQERISGAMGNKDRGAKEGWYRMDKNRGPDFFLKRTTCLALIIEPEFIQNIELINSKMISACQVISDSLIELEGV